MEREKLIEARSKFMRDNRSLIGNDGPLIADAFDACEEAIMSMPLADRLTDQEKEKIKAFYNGDTFGELDFIEIVSTRRILRNLFGKDLFNDE